jgi:hypothetical protein
VAGVRGRNQNLPGMSWEPISPELALVDPELGARARAALSSASAPARGQAPLPPRAPREAPTHEHRAYPFWARVTAALWLVVLGILIGGAAIPHAQEKPRVIPQSEDQRFCKAPPAQPSPPPQPPPSVPGRPVQ